MSHQPLHRRESASTARRLELSTPLPDGVVDIRQLPDDELLAFWDAVLVPDDIKQRLLAHAILNFTFRRTAPKGVLPLHGVLLLVGPPGTGKTSLAKGLASKVAAAFSDRDDFRYLEIDPHSLMSSAHGKTQRAVGELFSSTIREQLALGPAIVLLDEVETLVTDRAKLSFEANPADVHRATDAALVQLDHLANSDANVLFVATSNFPRAIDPAFKSRADLILEVPLPSEAGRLAILRDTLVRMAPSFPNYAKLAKSSKLERVAKLADGFDGRSMRKLVVVACAMSEDTARHPDNLTIDLLIAAASQPAGDHSR